MVGFEPSASETLTTNPCRRTLPDFLLHDPSALICQTSAVNIKKNFTYKTQKWGHTFTLLILY